MTSNRVLMEARPMGHRRIWFVALLLLTLMGCRMNTGIARQTGDAYENTIRAREGLKTNFISHSQGSALALAGINDTDFDAMRLEMAGGDEEQALTLREQQEEQVKVISNGSPANNIDMRNSVRGAGITWVNSNSNPGDPASEGLGGNKGDYVDPSLAVTRPDASTDASRSSFFQRSSDLGTGPIGLTTGNGAHSNHPCEGDGCGGDTADGTLQLPGGLGVNEGVNANPELPTPSPGRPDEGSLLIDPDLPRLSGPPDSNEESEQVLPPAIPFIDPQLKSDQLTIEQKIDATRAQPEQIEVYELPSDSNEAKQEESSND